MPLKYIKFKLVYYLTGADVLKINKLENYDEVVINPRDCDSITKNEQVALLKYISKINLKKLNIS